MDVNRDNYFSVLPEILQDINNADYVAIDGEFTGILPVRDMSYFDSPAERYKRHYECDKDYLMIQFGLAMIRCENAVEKRYSLKAYNFYLYPENEIDAFDFRSKSSSLQFLATNHFDFNQLFLKGIPSISQVRYAQKVKQQQRFAARQNNNQQTSNGNLERNGNNPMNNTSQQNASANPSDTEADNRRLKGFSEVIWKLQESGKPIIGHNLYTDIIHVIKQFFAPIPSSYKEYKSILNNLFPKIIDTKLIASTSFFQGIMPNTSLNAVYKTVNEQNFSCCQFDAPANFAYALGDHEHTAGYDATCTAICMAKMMTYIAEQTNFKENPIQHPLIDSFIGKMFFMASFDLRYVDLINDDFPNRSGVFYVKHPQSWSPFNLREYFRQWGQPFTERHDSTTHIVALPLQNETTDTLLTKMRAGNTHFNIVSYAKFHKLDLSKMKIRQPNLLFDIDPTKRSANQNSGVDAQNAIPSSPMDVTNPTLNSTSSTTNPLQTAIDHNAASSSAYSLTEKDSKSQDNDKKRPRVQKDKNDIV